MFYIMPYKLGSDSAKALANGLGLLRITGEKSLGKRDVVINWGNSNTRPFSRWGEVATWNRSSAVSVALNKLETFIALTKHGIITVPWTTDQATAKRWLIDSGIVVARTNITGCGGDGIVVVTGEDYEFPYAPLYTKHTPKCHEYRVHVAFGEVIDYSKKKRRDGWNVNEYIRNHASGWVFCREGVALPDKVIDASLKSIAVVGLDFGALDVLYKELDDSSYVLEINTSPGIEGTTLSKYVEAFKRRMCVSGN